MNNKNNKKDTNSVATAKPVKKVQGRLRNNSAVTKPAPVATAEPVKKSSGEPSDSEIIEVLNVTGEYVRGEFLADTFKPKMTVTTTNVTFNTACVNLFPNCQHISLCMDKEKRRLVIQPTEEYDIHCLKFANFKNARNAPRTCSARWLGGDIEPQRPTPEELILRQYGSTRPRKTETKKND